RDAVGPGPPGRGAGARGPPRGGPRRGARGAGRAVVDDRPLPPARRVRGRGLAAPVGPPRGRARPRAASGPFGALHALGRRRPGRRGEPLTTEIARPRA